MSKSKEMKNLNPYDLSSIDKHLDRGEKPIKITSLRSTEIYSVGGSHSSTADRLKKRKGR